MNSSLESHEARIAQKEAQFWKTKQDIQDKLIEIHGLIDKGLKPADSERYMLKLLWERLERQLNGLQLEGISERMLYERRAAKECIGLKNGD